VRALWKAVNELGPEAMRQWLAPTYVRHGSDRDYTRDEWIEVMAERSRAFPDNQSIIQDIVLNGDKVAYRWSSEGTHSETYLRIPATGRKVVAQGITISRFDRGLIQEEWASWNKTSVLHTLGILPIS
jgi:steroid delta-isomerase-like uncharacterized protein